MSHLKDIYFGIGQRGVGAPNNWVEWDETNLIDKPTLLVIGGVCTQSACDANGTARLFMRKPFPGMQIVSVYYGGWLEKNAKKVVGACVADEMVKRGQFSPNICGSFDFGLEEGECLSDYLISVQPYAERLFQTYIKPMLTGAGRPLPFEKAVKNMRLLNIATLSFGDFVLENLSDIMKRELYQMGYSVAQRVAIMKQVAVLNLNGVMPVGKRTGFTTLRVFSMRDTYNSMFQSRTLNRFLADTYRNPLCGGADYLMVSPIEKVFAVRKFLKGRDFADEHMAIFRNVNELTLEGKISRYVIRSFIRQAIQNSIENAHQKDLIPLPHMNKMLYCMGRIDGLDCRRLLHRYEKQANQDVNQYTQQGRCVCERRLYSYLIKVGGTLFSETFVRE